MGLVDEIFFVINLSDEDKIIWDAMVGYYQVRDYQELIEKLVDRAKATMVLYGIVDAGAVEPKKEPKGLLPEGTVVWVTDDWGKGRLGRVVSVDTSATTSLPYLVEFREALTVGWVEAERVERANPLNSI